MRSARGASQALVTIITLAIFAVVMLFFWQVLRYYRQISSGKAVLLPQFETRFTRSGASQGPEVAQVATEDDPSMGAADAKLVIVEFLDFECPYCYEVSSIVREVASAHQDKMRMIIRDFPVPEIHPDAVMAAEAAECAHRQGKFWPMHDRLFALKGRLTRPELERAAEQSGLELPAWRACLDGRAARAEVEEDAAQGFQAGVRGTPTFFFNGRKVEGAIPRDVFESLVAALTKE